MFGGDIAAMASWTLDAGDGVDDKLVVVGRGGDVLVYEGTDPASCDFRIAGRWAVGRVPVGRRFVSKYGGDLAIITPNGIERMSQLTAARGLNVPAGELGGTEDWVRYMERIAQDVRRDATCSPFWQMVHFAGEQCAIVLTPHNDRAGWRVQYVYGTLSGGWSEFAGVPMLSLEAHDGELYFGTKDGKVMQMFFGGTDDSLPDGTPGAAVIGAGADVVRGDERRRVPHQAAADGDADVHRADRAERQGADQYRLELPAAAGLAYLQPERARRMGQREVG